jgi:hypothetical protein
MEEPLYGFRTKVTLIENSPCNLDVDCNDQIIFSGQQQQKQPAYQKLQSKKEDLIEKQTGEEFSSDSPPDCRVFFDPNQCPSI